MEKITVGNIKFVRPVIEKVIDIYYLLEENGKEEVKHTYTILTYDEMDKDYEAILKDKGILQKEPKLVVVDETVSINFGDEEIDKHYDSVILFNKEWIETKNPDKENFRDWLLEFVDSLLFRIRRR